MVGKSKEVLIHASLLKYTLGLLLGVDAISDFPQVASDCAALGQYCLGMDSNEKSRATSPRILSLP